MAIDIHDDLRAAWRTIQSTPEGPKRTKMLALFDAMPEPLTLTWPDSSLGDQWQEILADPSHPKHDTIASTLKDFTGGIKARWKDDKKKLKDRLDWTLFFRENYRKIVAMGED